MGVWLDELQTPNWVETSVIWFLVVVWIKRKLFICPSQNVGVDGNLFASIIEDTISHHDGV